MEESVSSEETLNTRSEGNAVMQLQNKESFMLYLHVSYRFDRN